MPIVHVTTSKSIREHVSDEWARKIDEAKATDNVEDILFQQIAYLEDFLEREFDTNFRLVNLMTSEQLTAYEAIQRRLGPKASREEWSQAIKEWKEAQP
jgi:hypothetical protein